ncbi:nuclear transport factor 2 family protein [Streptomyces sp. NPDC055105]|uniref:nuclear transport factor 2 family protein n=1 Tax=Streptomyces sp. NPDC055105 TaxID=3365719 RepID=UPI0037D1EA80
MSTVVADIDGRGGADMPGREGDATPSPESAAGATIGEDSTGLGEIAAELIDRLKSGAKPENQFPDAPVLTKDDARTRGCPWTSTARSSPQPAQDTHHPTQESRMPHNHDIGHIADRLTQAVSTFDAELQKEVLSSDFSVWHNTDNETLDLEGAMAFLQNVGTKVTDVQYTDVRRVATDEGYVQEATILATTKSGKDTRNSTCIVVKLDDDGRVVSVREYQDSATFNVVLEG